MSLLEKVDMLSPRITLYYRKKNIHSSPISGFLTIIAYLLILIFTFYYMYRYLHRENPTAYFFNRYVNDAGIFPLKDSNFFNFIEIKEGRSRKTKELDFNKIEIIGINISEVAFLNFKGEMNFPHWLYGKCDDNIHKNKLGNLIDNDTFNNAACIKKFYNLGKGKPAYYDINDENFEWPIIKGGASNPNFTFFGVVIKKCQNTTFRKQNFQACDSEEEIDKYLDNTFVSFTILDHYVDVLNYEAPITKFLYALTSGVSNNSYIANNLNFNPGLVKTYDNLFIDNTKEQHTYFFHQNTQKSSSSEGNEFLAVFMMWLQNSQQYYERRYPKIQDALPQIGGFGSVVIMIAKCINYLISRFIMLKDTQKLISSVLKDNNTIFERIKKSQNFRPFMGEISNRKKEEITHLRLFNSERNVKQIMNTEISEDGKDEDKKIIGKRINVINSNNLGDETNRMNKNSENSKDKIIPGPKSDAFKEVETKFSKNMISLNLTGIEKNKEFNCFNYFWYMVLCKRINPNIKDCENLRRLIMSEEIMLKNYLYINKLLELNLVK